jgi:hypothetical protein
MLNAFDFIRDSLFCEYAYVVNLDDGLFEVYEGFQREPHDKGRYAAIEPDPEDVEHWQACHGHNWYPCALVGSFPLRAIPDDWAAQCQWADDEEEPATGTHG